ncbi:MAG: peptide chain release factor N(5)-glutamine methyltransferase, partial [Clostridia bacterium]|nr:peptide chain release factor N(5)-glutamine methyltransferase [Clostridia bacterium]
MLKTLYNTYLDLRQELRLKGIPMYQLEAKEIIAFALEIPREDFNERDDRIVFLKEQEKIDSLVRLRLSGTPLPHIIGEWDFYGLTFEVTTNTLIPRSDTECIAEEGIEFLKQFDKARVLDLCCGTGCIGITLLKNSVDQTTCLFGDISDYAIRVTKNNIMKHNVTGRSLTMKLNALEPYSPVIGKFQLIVSNPPYIPTADIETLDTSVKD